MVGGRQHQATGRTSKVCDSLQGNAVFTARLLSSGNMVLVHPMEERGEVFLPCCYGYATTIRRAQGADLSLGCIYMDHKFPAGRGYGYVACSRFKTRAGCFLYGKLRRTDFLPVGEEQEDEVLERGRRWWRRRRSGVVNLDSHWWIELRQPDRGAHLIDNHDLRAFVLTARGGRHR